MYLEKLEIQGFKSFANKNKLVFPGMLDKTRRGITAVVGPNGSGKSNVADAVRWALGEQSMKTLRGKKFEDVIFSGSDKKGKLGMAEVSLYLNNESKQAPIDYSEIVLTRRLFRNGDSEYILNNNKVRLSDIQILLAKAKFGQKTYSVIGQGVVEGFLNTTLSERKEFFDEATGVKQYQIKRDDSLNKLRRSYDNLNQADMLLSEIEPRLRSLTRQVNKLRRRGEIETELRDLQLKYYGRIWHEISAKFNDYNKRFLELEKTKMEKERRLSGLNNELNQMETESRDLAELNEWQRNLSEMQSVKESLTGQLARIEARAEMKLEAAGRFDLSWLQKKRDELAEEIARLTEEIKGHENNIEPARKDLAEREREKNRLDNSIGDINRRLSASGSGLDNRRARDIHDRLKRSLGKLEQAEAEHDINKVKSILREIRAELEEIAEVARKEGGEESLERARNDLIKYTEAREKVIVTMNEARLRVSARTERVKLLTEKRIKLETDLAEVRSKLERYGGGVGSEGDDEETKGLKAKLTDIENKIEGVRAEITRTGVAEEEKRTRLFALQKNIQSLQNEVNTLANNMNELRINSTRYETKLEDLEIEIRHGYGDLNKIREYKVESEIDVSVAREKIDSLKRQLDLIGGIDPEIENEYTKTKERFDFLHGQAEDLTKTIESLEKVIRELDLTIKERFDKEFKVIADKFEEYFKILFGGGTAKIIKVMEEEKEGSEKTESDEGEGEEDAPPQDKESVIDLKRIKFLQKHNATGLAGIEIKAVPPGKKIKSIAMLSGGERALTAIALICAIISANPSPFVVLDEVDAALDEANSERFARILDDLSHKTQFIVITHNRATMRRANILYGITMSDDGVSKLLSIKLDEAREIVS